jgi:hypothetical protein
MSDTFETNPNHNPFDNLSALRLDQSYADTVGVKKLLTTVPVRKPNRQDFVRVHPDPKYRLTPTAIIEVKEDREVYLVTPDMAQALPGEFATVTLFTVINRQGKLHLWPVKLPNPEGRHNEWHRSAAEGAERAQKKWVRVTASMSLGAYEIFEASGDLPDPAWPDFSFPEILKIASATASWTVPITPWCSGFRGSCSHGKITHFSQSDRCGRRRRRLPGGIGGACHDDAAASGGCHLARD